MKILEFKWKKNIKMSNKAKPWDMVGYTFIYV